MSVKRTLIPLLILISFLFGSCQNIPSGMVLERNEPSTPVPGTNTPYSILPEITPMPSVTPTPPCTDRVGSIVLGQILSGKLAKPMNYNVYLPPCYYHNVTERYSVLYLLHGQANSEFEWIQLGINTAADEMISAGIVKPFIMVFPFDYSHLQPDQYAFADVFIGNLMPEVDRLYRTLDDGNHRAIGGISRGGAWAFHLGVNYPQLFASVGGHSPSIFFADGKDLPKKMLSVPTNELPRLWIDIGESDPGLPLMRNFHNLLTENGIEHSWNLNKGYHEEKYWQTHSREYLLWYNAGW